MRGGLVLHASEGSAVVAATEPHAVTVPVTAFVPVAGADDVLVPAVGLALRADAPTGSRVGTAEVDAGRRPLGSWLYLHYLAPFWR